MGKGMLIAVGGAAVIAADAIRGLYKETREVREFPEQLNPFFRFSGPDWPQSFHPS